jgi:hypothetical protein
MIWDMAAASFGSGLFVLCASDNITLVKNIFRQPAR